MIVKFKFTMRFVKSGDLIYIREEDVIRYVVEVVSAEETDVRNCLEESAENIGEIGILKDD